MRYRKCGRALHTWPAIPLDLLLFHQQRHEEAQHRLGTAVYGFKEPTPLYPPSLSRRYAIPLQELTCSGKFLCGLEGGGEIDVAEADSGPHGFEAFDGEPIETTVLDPCDKSVAAELGDQA